ncbi:MAG: hypothetical protein E7399_03745 [Ruminococcaceae bacterium]|nr:hypothetical protein [Oscillospiraceae bacterium]
MKRLLLLLLVFVLLGGNLVYAYEYPTEFWDWNSKYEKALAKKNYDDIIYYGTKQIKMIERYSIDRDGLNMLRNRLNAVGDAHAVQGSYDAAADMFRKYIQYSDAEDCTDHDWDGLRAAKAKVLQYESQIRIFSDVGKTVYFGEENEPENGVLYGASSDGAIRQQLDHESIVLLYQELGHSVNDWSREIFKQARSKGLVVEFALNCPEEREDIFRIRSYTSNLSEISEFLAEYEDVPVLLRFGAEFNEWSKPEDAAAFVTAFRYVSDFFKTRNENVAMVWSPLQEGKWDIQLEDFYPGDHYVDWIGISAYSNYYHQGNPDTEEKYEIVYKSGVNADPVLAVSEIVETFGQNKPVLIAESGFSHKTYPTGENTMNWAVKRMKEFYSYLPMVYPQIKGVAYFDRFYEGEPNDYSLKGDLKETYLKMIQNPRMIQQGNETSFSYRELKDGSQVDRMTGIYTYAHLYGQTTKKVTYYIDGKWAGESTDMPFGVYLEFGKGAKQLRVVAEGDWGAKTEKTFTLNASSWQTNDVDVFVDDKEVQFDQPPVIYNNRTLVPLRAVFEALGATVNWDGNTKTVTGKKDRRTVTLTIGSNVMYLNQKPIFLDVPAIQVNGRTLVPARAVAEGLGAEVEWLGDISTVWITPIIQQWSDWETKLPSEVRNNQEDYYIEEKEQYRYRDTEYRDTKNQELKRSSGWILEESWSEKGDWSDWTTKVRTETEFLQRESREVIEDTTYLFAHYCTGYITDVENRYYTRTYDFHSECLYHELGWFHEYELTEMEDGVGYRYGDYRCSNTCFRWYKLDENHTYRTEYRYRDIDYYYSYYRISDWSDYEDDYPGRKSGREIEERTVYRWKHI